MLRKVLNQIEKLISLVLILLFVSMTLVLVYQVVLRYVFNRSNIWAEEYARFSLVWMCTLGSAIAFRRYKHITITTVSDMLPKMLMKYIDIIMYIIMAGFIAVVFYQGILYVQGNMNKVSTGLGISQGLIYLCIPISALLMEVFLIECIHDKVGKLREGSAK